MTAIQHPEKAECMNKNSSNLISNAVTVLLFVLSTVAIIYNQEVYAAVTIAAVWCIIAMLTDDILLLLSPILFISVFVTRCYDSFDTFIVYKWMAVPILLALIVHFIRFNKKIRFGASFFGLCAVSAALILGGLGSISPELYFRPITLFYTLGLGVGMLAIYIIFQPSIHCENKPLCKERLLISIYLMGLLALICIANFYRINIDHVLATHTHVVFQSSNNLSTIIMIAMPIPCYFASKNKLHLIPFFLMLVGLLLANSRGGIIFGFIEMIICSIVFIIKDKNCRIVLSVLLLICICILVVFFNQIMSFLSLSVPEELNNSSIIDKIVHVFINEGEARRIELSRLKDDFLSNVLFGRGIGHENNLDIYTPRKGGMNWYHMWLPQIIGSMGLVGIFAYFSNLILRIYLVFKKKSLFSTTVGLSYLGLFLMSQVNPGEFCPFPYSMLAVLVFSSIDEFKTKNNTRVL